MCLHIAAINNYLSMVESLVQLGADVNAKVRYKFKTLSSFTNNSYICLKGELM